MDKQDKQYVESILRDYETDSKELTKVEKLRALDRSAKFMPRVFAYTFGVIGSLILGFGMCVAMGIILQGLFALGIVVGLVGIAMVSVNYFIYKKLLMINKQKYAEDIKNLSNEILNNDK